MARFVSYSTQVSLSLYHYQMPGGGGRNLSVKPLNTLISLIQDGVSFWYMKHSAKDRENRTALFLF